MKYLHFLLICGKLYYNYGSLKARGKRKERGQWEKRKIDYFKNRKR